MLAVSSSSLQSSLLHRISVVLDPPLWFIIKALSCTVCFFYCDSLALPFLPPSPLVQLSVILYFYLCKICSLVLNSDFVQHVHNLFLLFFLQSTTVIFSTVPIILHCEWLTLRTRTTVQCTLTFDEPSLLLCWQHSSVTLVPTHSLALFLCTPPPPSQRVFFLTRVWSYTSCTKFKQNQFNTGLKTMNYPSLTSIDVECVQSLLLVVGVSFLYATVLH